MSGARVERRLAAVLAADVAGYSRLMGLDEEGTLARLKTVRRTLVDPTIAAHRGRIVKTTGDGMLVEFASAVDAARCAMDIQREMAAQNVEVSQDVRFEFRIGIHVGDIIIDENDIFGDGVNIAARLEGIAEPGGICMSDDAYRQVRSKVEIVSHDLGPLTLKNIAEPMRTWRVHLGGQGVATAQPAPSKVEPSAPVFPDKPSIAVLPFQNMSGDPEQEYFADGMVEDIITALSRVKWFFVIARNSSFTYKGRAVDIKQVGRELGVRYVLEGSVRKAAGKVRITGQLIEAETGHHIWADRFEGDYNNIFELQDEITSAVAAAVEPRLNLTELQRSNRKPTVNLTAYDCFLRAQPFFLRPVDIQSYKRAEDLLRQATAIDPHYSSALAYLADCIGRQCVSGSMSYSEGIHEAAKISQQAVEADPEDAAALAVATWVFSVFIGRLDLAREYADRALQLHPNSNFVCTNAGYAFIYLGELLIARKTLENAFRLSPLDPRNWFNFLGRGIVAFFERNFEEALTLLTRASDLSPLAIVPWRYRAAALVHLGRTKEAQEAVMVLRSFTPAPTLKELSDRAHYAQSWMKVLYLDALQKAGYE